jgi:hypothetical protein
MEHQVWLAQVVPVLAQLLVAIWRVDCPAEVDVSVQKGKFLKETKKSGAQPWAVLK